MVALPEDVELAVLAVLAEAEAPLGSPRMAEGLSQRGLSISEATAGRYLHSLQVAGYTHTAGTKQGRTITAKGRRRLAELNGLRSLAARGNEVAQAARIGDVDDLIAVLQVRRGVEAEAAALAARNGSAAQLRAIHALAVHHVETSVGGSTPTSQESTAFHMDIAKASCNPVLISVTGILVDPANQQRLHVGEEVTTKANVIRRYAAEHVEISKALVARDAAKAERLMRAHLGNYLEEAERFRAAGRAGTSADRA